MSQIVGNLLRWRGLMPLLIAARMTTDSPEDARSRLAAIHDAMDRAARLTGRKGADIDLVAISKTKDADAIRPLITAGQRIFGENRVQEAQAKWPALRAETPGIVLHLVGQLQSNKAADAVALFDVIHSLDRPSLLTALARAMDAAGKRVPCYIQVNIGAEAQKGGCAIADTSALIASARAADIPLLGLMCVPPADTEPAPYFALLAKMAREEGLPRLSMGMSGDYETAIMLGATDIRVGAALFGARPAPARPIPTSGQGMARNTPQA
jgi:pyridoxal phosphate enzyme (YggS family)